MSLEQAIQEIMHELPPHKQRELFDYASRLQAESAKKLPFRSIEGLWAHRRIGRSEERGYYADKPKQPEPRDPRETQNRGPRRQFN